MANTTTLLSIPFEILIQIWGYLGTSDHGAFRQTCKQLEATSFDCFGSKYFGQKQFMLTHESLSVLLAISKSRFAPFLKHVIISHERFIRHPNPEFRRPHALSTQMSNYCAQYADQIIFQNLGIDIEMLTEAFRGLDLETAAVHNESVFSQYGRHLARSSESHGSRAVQQATGISLMQSCRLVHDQEHRAYTAAMVTKLLYALGKANATPRRLDFPIISMPDIALNIPFYLENSVRDMLAHVKHLRFGLEWPSLWPIDRRLVVSEGQNQEIDTYHLRRFVGYCTQPNHLEIYGSGTMQVDQNSFLRWLAAAPQLALPSSNPTVAPIPVAFPSLRNFILRFVTMDRETMLFLIEKVGFGLHSLTLTDITLYSDSGNADDASDHWPSCLLKLSAVAPKLKEIQIARVVQGRPYSMVYFQIDEGRTNSANHTDHTGVSMQTYLQALASTLIL